MSTCDPLLQVLIDSINVPGILVAHRLINDGDEFALLPEERSGFANSIVRVQRAGAAARIVARNLLLNLGQGQQALPRSVTGVPIWPDGVVGSLTHDAAVAAAAIARKSDFVGLGIDVEPNEPLDDEIVDSVVHVRERKDIPDDPRVWRVLFTVKEAVYKAVYPLDGTFLDHQDVEVSLREQRAVIRTGRIVDFRYRVATHILALAFVPAATTRQEDS